MKNCLNPAGRGTFPKTELRLYFKHQLFALNILLINRTAIVALGHIAFHMPDKFPVQVKNRVSRNIVKELLMQDKTEPRSDDGTEWCEFDDLPLETKCKIEGMKMMARWLVGLKV